jgi:hypothetical protein
MRGEGSGELDGDQTKTRAHESLLRFSHPEGKDLRPACLICIDVVLQQGVYSGGVDWI